MKRIRVCLFLGMILTVTVSASWLPHDRRFRTLFYSNHFDRAYADALRTVRNEKYSASFFANANHGYAAIWMHRRALARRTTGRPCTIWT